MLRIQPVLFMNFITNLYFNPRALLVTRKDARDDAHIGDRISERRGYARSIQYRLGEQVALPGVLIARFDGNLFGFRTGSMHYFAGFLWLRRKWSFDFHSSGGAEDTEALVISRMLPRWSRWKCLVPELSTVAR